MISANDEYFKFKGGWHANNLGKITFSAKFVLSCLPKANLVNKKETFRVYTREGVSPKPFFTAEAKVAA
jgi:hypothetical protein